MLAPCSLCGNEARVNSTPNFGRYKALECAACGQFVISDAAHDHIQGLPVQFADDWRSMIQAATPDQILQITMHPVGSGGGLKVELVARSTLRL